MQKRRLGKSNLEVSAIGLGCMGMTFSFPPFPEKKDMILLIRKSVELSVTFWILLKYMDRIIMRNLWVKLSNHLFQM